MSKLSKYKNSEIDSANREYPLLIIGAGLNGLAAAYELKKTGAEPVILDSSGQPASAWRSRHDQLRLNTHRLISHLPGMRIPGSFGAFPSRDDMVRYLEDYETFLDLPIHRNVRVKRIDSVKHGWRLTASDGIWMARNVIIATGHERVPVIPAWPGRSEFTGKLIHAAHFGPVDRFKDKRILVVGAGNSGTDVLNHLVRIRTKALWVSVRNGPAILPTTVLGIPLQLLSPLMAPLPAWSVDLLMAATARLIFGNLKKFNLPKHPDGVATRLIKEGVAPAFDNGFVSALRVLFHLIFRRTWPDPISRLTNQDVTPIPSFRISCRYYASALSSPLSWVNKHDAPVASRRLQRNSVSRFRWRGKMLRSASGALLA